MSNEVRTALCAVEGASQTRFDDGQDVLSDIYKAWLVRTQEGNVGLIEEELARLTNDASNPAASSIQAAGVLVEGYVALIAQDFMEEGFGARTKIEQYKIGQKAIERYFESAMTAGRAVLLDEVIDAITNSYGKQGSSNHKPSLRLVADIAKVATSEGGESASPLQELYKIDKRLAVIVGEEVGVHDRAVIARLLDHPVLESATQIQLVEAAQGGDEAAREKLITHTMRWIATRARRKISHGLSFLDLLQEGVMGINHAIDKFDTSKGVNFITYATDWIDQAMMRAIHNKSLTVRLPVHVHEQNRQINKARTILLQRARHEPSERELAEATGFSPRHIADIQRALSTMSLDAPLSVDEGSASLVDFVRDPSVDVAEEAARNVDNHAVVALIDRLPADQAKAIKMHFGLIDGVEHTYTVIGGELGVSRQAAQQKVGVGLASLRKLLENTGQPKPPQAVMELPAQIEDKVPKPSIKDEPEVQAGRPVPKRTKKPLSAGVVDQGHAPSSSHLDHLVLANERRLAAAAVRQRLRSGEARLAEALDDPVASKIGIASLLKCLPGAGPVKIKKILKEANVHPRTEVGALGDDEKASIETLTSANIHYRGRTTIGKPPHNPSAAAKALERANAIRLRAAEIKNELNIRKMTIEDVFDEQAGLRMRVIDVLKSLPYRANGASRSAKSSFKAEAIMQEADLPPEIKCGQLTDNQRSQLMNIVNSRIQN